MDSVSSSAPTNHATNSSTRRRRRCSGPYRGVRMRAWGKWVSEIRVPKTGKRIWLGSYDAPEKAARAYDAAQYCIRGRGGPFNFPAERRPELPQGSMDPLSKEDIQSIATSFASSDPSSHAMAPSSSMTTEVSLNTPVLPDVVSGASGAASETVNEPYLPLGAGISDLPAVENLQLDDFLMLEWISELY